MVRSNREKINIQDVQHEVIISFQGVQTCQSFCGILKKQLNNFNSYNNQENLFIFIPCIAHMNTNMYPLVSLFIENQHIKKVYKRHVYLVWSTLTNKYMYAWLLKNV